MPVLGLDMDNSPEIDGNGIFVSQLRKVSGELSGGKRRQ
jgi:hypothetical protein